MTRKPKLEMPPVPVTESGTPRRVGVELEFIGVDPSEAARLVAAEFGGRVVEEDEHAFRVACTPHGDFKVELDMRLAHPEKREAADDWEALANRLDDELRLTIGHIGKMWMPTEVVTPPIPFEALPEVDSLVDLLADAGARSTREQFFYAFGTHLNPEIESEATESILSVVRAYIVLSAWLRESIEPHMARRILPFVDPFPEGYGLLVLDPAYAPDRATLIDDYLRFNPTRNRELDVLPLFAYLDEARVRAEADDALIKARPTWHYRLPDCRIGDPDWSVVGEWNRWVAVERLAHDPARLDEAARAFMRHHVSWVSGDWLPQAERWARGR